MKLRKLFFAGSLINLKHCGPGYYGFLCNKCHFNTFKPTFGEHPCIQCPCKSDLEYKDEQIERVSIGTCRCERSLSIYWVYYILAILGGGMTIFMVGCYFIFDLFESKKDYIKDLMLKLSDIPYSVKKLEISGSNIPSNPWKMPSLNDFKRDIIKSRKYLLFVSEFDKHCKWSTKQIILLNICYYISFSPSYLVLLRFFRSKKASALVKLIEQQKRYVIFENPNHILKWYQSSDYSTMFIEIVEDIQYPKYDWKLKFPVKFPILGTGSYNKPFKLEMKDPNVIKVIDYLKDFVNDDEGLYAQFDIPCYLRNAVIDSRLGSHFLEFYFCLLVAKMKSCTTNCPKRIFLKNFKEFGNFICKGNQVLFMKEGFELQVNLHISRTVQLQGSKFQK